MFSPKGNTNAECEARGYPGNSTGVHWQYAEWMVLPCVPRPSHVFPVLDTGNQIENEEARPIGKGYPAKASRRDLPPIQGTEVLGKGTVHPTGTGTGNGGAGGTLA